MESSKGDSFNLLRDVGLSEDEDFLKESLDAERWLEARKAQERSDEAVPEASVGGSVPVYESGSPIQPSSSLSTIRQSSYLTLTAIPRSRASQQAEASVSPGMLIGSFQLKTENANRKNTANFEVECIDLTHDKPVIVASSSHTVGTETQGAAQPLTAVSSQYQPLHYRQQQMPRAPYPGYNSVNAPSATPMHGEEFMQRPFTSSAFLPATATNASHIQHRKVDSSSLNGYLNVIPQQALPNISLPHIPFAPILNGLAPQLGGIYDGTRSQDEANVELRKLLDNIRPDQDLERNCEGTPRAMKYTLMEHQKLGLAWMKSMEEGSNRGGILADDMGLGKTIQALALILSRPSSDFSCKATLVVAPVFLMHQWKREIEQKIKTGSQLSVYILHGDKKTTPFSILRKYDVVLTSYGTVASEFGRREQLDLVARQTPNLYQSHPLHSKLSVFGEQSKWHRVILDEAQCIKNRKTKAAQACCYIESTYRWCMSGTPMMNCIKELYSLLRFLRIGPYNHLERFNTAFSRPLQSGSRKDQHDAMKRLQALLKATLLRRTKTSKINGQPILQLPPKTIEKIHVVFSEDETRVYNILEARTRSQFTNYLDAGTVGRHYSNVLVMLLRLRQACCHPHLVKIARPDLAINIGNIDLIGNAKLLSNEVVTRLTQNGDVECPVCIDAVDNAIIFFPCGHNICAECFSKISDPSRAVVQGIDGILEIKCPNCRARIDPKKVTDSNSFQKVFVTGDYVDTVENNNDDNEESDTSDEDSDDSEAEPSYTFIDAETDVIPKPKKRKRTGTVKEDKKYLVDLKRAGLRNAKAKRKYIRHLKKNWETSTKIEKALEIIRDIESQGNGEKVIIFSQFTSLLDLLEVPIARERWGYRRYDGSMSPVERNGAVLDFTDNSNCRIMLVSLKAGNSGLNLVSASQVIIFDPFWNPYVEDQAIDRAHRIGQTRPVTVHRILVQNTVEDRILQLQEEKRELIESALDEKASMKLGRLEVHELAFLFNVPRNRGR
ncbi:hypothetical protein LOZ57_001765 [Ophidiomyces ophidiicola]|uniref:uncharacterized protein n=1 Tax=Ophidiomyces ophidiicola TaxID=1387563 RepID=UPI0020C3FE4B|nr:uncharacterized protein LOZ57_001765 [Ophidiomyces ophidiicola]KAI1951211.1 hypothetical protein LOZ57_001765 [Ophidiomyces ophidiicola]KAI2046156.1 hypothetical protein LOZ43_005935 [Ophidiomyces ophidiicola]